MYKVVYESVSGELQSAVVIASSFSECVEKISKLVKIVSVSELDEKNFKGD